ncbi:MAG: flagellar hook protein FlgE [Piscirickettsiaceae bacterium]|nr:MAG: flagellar hook protein FlgE [Piscirickettsiaceae bacterium]
MSFRTSLSGLDAAATDLSVVGNNIANASTNGFKESRAEFVDVFATSFSGVSGNTPGSGVRVSTIAQQFSQGNIEFTSSNLDLAINGEGFFILDDNGSLAYTRAGAYTTDRDGFIVDSSGRQLQVFPPNNNGTFNTGSLASIQLSTNDSAPAATSTVDPVLNLDSRQGVPINPTFDPLDADTYNHSTSTTVYDSLGNDFPATMYFVSTNPATNTWDVHTQINGTTVTVGGGASFSLSFNTDGTFQTANGSVTGQVTLDSFSIGNGSAPINITFDYQNMTQYGSDFAVNGLSQNGFASGRLSGIDIDPSGVVFAQFTNGQSKALGQIALGTFPNSQGLRQLGDSSWAETFSSGDRIVGAAGTAGFGNLQSAALESSNVDIATQLVNLITSQRNFQANAQAISTQDTIQQAIINIR